MILFKEVKPLQEFLFQQKTNGKSISFVPTMGALHHGHLALITAALASSDIAVCSIFINPTQFNNKKDFDKYPVTISNDIFTLEKAGCNVLFLPSIDEVYPGGTSTLTHFDIGALETMLEGAFRPGHFQGVCQVVDRLLQVVQPDQLFLGQKDYQQTLVLKRLINTKQIPVQISIVSTCREDSGLAMSSRNLRLNHEQKASAAAIYKAMQTIKAEISTVPFRLLEQQATAYLLSHQFVKVDYVRIANANTLEPATFYTAHERLIVLVAAYMGEVRLIDNLLL